MRELDRARERVVVVDGNPDDDRIRAILDGGAAKLDQRPRCTAGDINDPQTNSWSRRGVLIGP